MSRLLLLLLIVTPFGPLDWPHPVPDRGAHSLPASPLPSIQDGIIEDVVIRGNRRLTREAILDSIGSRPGKPYEENQAQKDLRALLALGQFDPMRTWLQKDKGPRDGVILTFVVKEYPVIRELQFRGLGSVSEDEVLARFKNLGIEIGRQSVLTPQKIGAATKALRQLLAERQRPQTRVSVEVKDISPVAVDVTFNVVD